MPLKWLLKVFKRPFRERRVKTFEASWLLRWLPWKFMVSRRVFILSLSRNGVAARHLRGGRWLVVLFRRCLNKSLFFTCLVALVIRIRLSWLLRIVLGSGDFLSEVAGFLPLDLWMVRGIRRGRIFQGP